MSGTRRAADGVDGAACWRRSRAAGRAKLLSAFAQSELRTGVEPQPLRSRGEWPHDCVKALLDFGADPAQATGRSARTALHGAMRFNHPEVVRALVASGADPDRSSLSGVTARELGGVESIERYTWQNHTSTKILGDPFYLSAAETEQHPSLDDVLHSAVYAAEAQRGPTRACGRAHNRQQNP